MQNILAIFAWIMLLGLPSACRTNGTQAHSSELKAVQDELHILALKQDPESTLFGFEICLTNDDETGPLLDSCTDAFYDRNNKPLRFDFYTVMEEELSEEQLQSIKELSELKARYDQSKKQQNFKRDRGIGVAFIVASIIQTSLTWFGASNNRLPSNVAGASVGILLGAVGVQILFGVSGEVEEAKQSREKITEKKESIGYEFLSQEEGLPVLFEYWWDSMDPLGQAKPRQLGVNDDISVRVLTQALAQKLKDIAWAHEKNQIAQYCWLNIKKYRRNQKKKSAESKEDIKECRQI